MLLSIFNFSIWEYGFAPADGAIGAKKITVTKVTMTAISKLETGHDRP